MLITSPTEDRFQGEGTGQQSRKKELCSPELGSHLSRLNSDNSDLFLSETPLSSAKGSERPSCALLNMDRVWAMAEEERWHTVLRESTVPRQVEGLREGETPVKHLLPFPNAHSGGCQVLWCET
jgi:hypothetical protein